MALGLAPLTWLWLELMLAWGLRRYRRAVKEAPELHWTQRARLTWGTRSHLASAFLGLSLVAGLGAYFRSGSCSFTPPAVTALVAVFSIALGARLPQQRLSLSLGFPRHGWRAEAATYFLAFRGLLGVGLWFLGCHTLGRAWAERSGLDAALGLGLLFLVGLGFSRRLALGVGAMRASPELLEALREQARAVGVQPRSVDVLPLSQANAFASPLTRRLGVTERLLRELSHEEMLAILGHELGHLREGLGALSRLVPLGLLGVSAFVYGAWIQGHGQWTLLWVNVSLFVVLGLWWWARWLSVRLERRADRSALEQAPAELYCRALERCYELNLVPAVLVRARHPSLYERMTDVGITPGYARPEPPLRGPALWGGTLVVVAVLAFFYGPTLADRFAGDARVELRAVLDKDAWAMGELGRRAFLGGQPERSALLYAAAESLEPDSPWYPSNHSRVLLSLGRCPAAREALGRASANLSRLRALAEADSEELQDAMSLVQESSTAIDAHCAEP